MRAAVSPLTWTSWTSWTSPLRVLPLVAIFAAASMTSFADARAQTKRSAALVMYGTAADEAEPALRAALSSLATISVKEKAATQADLAAAAELGTSCSAEAIECLGSLAVLLRVDVLVVARAADRPEGIALDVSAVDGARGKELSRERQTIPDASARAAVRDVIEALLEPGLHFGTITVNAPEGSTARLDDAPLTLGEAARVRSGPHHLEVTREAHAPFAQDVDVVAGQDIVVPVTLTPLQASGVSPTAPGGSGLSGGWIIAGSGAAIAVVGGAVALGMDVGLGAGLGSAAEKEGYQALGVMGLVVASTGAAVAVTGAAIALLAD